MEFLRDVLLFAHFIGLAVLLGAFFAQIGKSDLRITPGMFHGALTMLVTGVGLVGVRHALFEDDPVGYPEVDNAKIAVKLAILVAIFVVILLNRRKEKVGVGPWLSVGLLGIANVAVAVFWK